MYNTNTNERKPGQAVADAARGYIRRGWNPVPIKYRDKKPSAGTGWQNIKIDESNVDQHFNGGQQNIGIQAGAASGGLRDVDLDSPEALALAPAILPPTDAIFGRRSTPRSHWLYVTDEIVDNATIAFDDPNRRGDEARLLELRLGGGGKAAQTVVPPSTHKETGELISWEKNGEPARTAGSELLRRARLLASACLLVRYWPPTGSGCHDAALAVGGFLARTGMRPEQVRRLVMIVTNFQNPARTDDLPRTAADAATKYFAGDRSFGFPQFAKIFGEAVAKEVAEWLGFRHKGAASGQSVPPPRDSEDWPDPIALPSGLEKVPPFDPKILPEGSAPWLTDISERMQVPIEFVAVPSMVMFGSLLGNKIGLARRSSIAGLRWQTFGAW
jgi:Bifunctional DNA primase/polymerase, N-terminal